MKICYLAAADSIHSYRWIKFFADRGHEVHWMSLSPPMEGAREFEPLEVISPRFKPLRVMRAALIARRLLRGVRPDILHAHYAGAYGLAGALTGFHPYVLTAWGSDVLIAGRSRAAGPFIRFALRRADVITVDAAHMAEAVAAQGVPKERIRRVYFGTDTAVFRPEARSEELRHQLRGPIVISLRNLEPVYDVATLLRASPRVLQMVPGVTFLIAGRGTQEDGLRRLADTLGVADHVRFTGHLPPLDLPRYLASADVYVSTALSDAGLAASTAEAMASGLPVIVTDTGENRVWVRDGVNGFVVPPSAPEALAEKVVYLLRHSDARVGWGEVNRRIILERNDYRREMGRMEDIYRALSARTAVP